MKNESRYLLRENEPLLVSLSSRFPGKNLSLSRLIEEFTSALDSNTINKNIRTTNIYQFRQ